MLADTKLILLVGILNSDDTIKYVSKYIAIALILSIVLLFICKKTGLFKRRTIVLNILTTLYYLYIPVIFIGFASVFFCAKYSEPILAKTVDSAYADFANNFPLEEFQEKAKLSPLFKFMFNAANANIADTLSKNKPGEILKKLAEKEEQLYKKLDSTLLNKLLQEEMNRFQKKVLAAFIILLILPFAETAISKVKGW